MAVILLRMTAFFENMTGIPKVPRIYPEEELFIKLNEESLHHVRIYGGLHVCEQPHFIVDLFYVWQKQRERGLV